MTRETRFEQARTLLGDYVSKWIEPEADRLDAVVSAGRLIPAVQVLIDAQWGYLSAITGLDNGVESGVFESLYHFCVGDAILTLRVPADRVNPAIPSVCGVIPYASPHERETGEMFGVVYSGTPDTSRLFLPDDWEAGVYPLRKDVQFEEAKDDRAE
jgi:Ni,Fe-hydrogenase III component G